MDPRTGMVGIRDTVRRDASFATYGRLNPTTNHTSVEPPMRCWRADLEKPILVRDRCGRTARRSHRGDDTPPDSFGTSLPGHQRREAPCSATLAVA
jgi:hypothetical protein